MAEIAHAADDTRWLRNSVLLERHFRLRRFHGYAASLEQLKCVAEQYKAIHLSYARLKNRQCLRASEDIPIK